MNHCAIQNTVTTREEMRSSVSVALSISDKRDTVVCPKPRRPSIINTSTNEPIRPLRWQMSNQSELCDSKAGNELLDIILSKGVYNVDQNYTQAASSPPFFCGSPPSRVSNPIIQDSRFGDENVTPISPRSIPILSGTQDARFGDEKATPISPMSIPILSGTPLSPSSSRKGTCARANFGNKPAVRVEGFDCLDRDGRNCSIPTMA